MATVCSCHLRVERRCRYDATALDNSYGYGSPDVSTSTEDAATISLGIIPHVQFLVVLAIIYERNVADISKRRNDLLSCSLRTPWSGGALTSTSPSNLLGARPIAPQDNQQFCSCLARKAKAMVEESMWRKQLHSPKKVKNTVHLKTLSLKEPWDLNARNLHRLGCPSHWWSLVMFGYTSKWPAGRPLRKGTVGWRSIVTKLQA